MDCNSRGTVYIDDFQFWGYMYIDETSLIICDVTHDEPIVSGKIKFKDIISLQSSQKNGNIILKLDYCRYKGTTKSRIYKRIIFVYPIFSRENKQECKKDDEVSSINNYDLTNFITNNLNTSALNDVDILDNTPNEIVNNEKSSDTDNSKGTISVLDMFELKKSTGQVVAKFTEDYELDSDEEWNLIDPSAQVPDKEEQEDIIRAFNDEEDEDEDDDNEDDEEKEEDKEDEDCNISSNNKEIDNYTSEEISKPNLTLSEENVRKLNDSIQSPSENNSCPYDWYDDLFDKLHLQKNKFLFIVNPVAGKGASFEIFNYMVEPILKNTKTDYKMVMTSSTVNSILNILVEQGEELDEYTGIVGIGGDGTVADILNGLYFLKKLYVPVSSIPAGSGNGISKCITEKYKEDFTPLNCFFRIITGASHPMDLSICVQGKTETISFLSQSWGLASEVDIDSEPFRFLGSVRFTLGTLWKLVRYRNYPGTLEYTHINGEEKKITDNFIMVWGCQLPWIAHDMNLSPDSTFNDKCIYLFVMREGMTRFEMLNMFLKADNGSHVHIMSDKFSIIPVIGYTLTPSTSASYITIDGEKVNTEAISVQLLQETGYVRC